MSDSYKGCWVAFEDDFKTPERIVEAIKMIRGVSAVTLSVADHDDWMARNRIKSEIRDSIIKLWEDISK